MCKSKEEFKEQLKKDKEEILKLRQRIANGDWVKKEKNESRIQSGS